MKDLRYMPEFNKLRERAEVLRNMQPQDVSDVEWVLGEADTICTAFLAITESLDRSRAKGDSEAPRDALEAVLTAYLEGVDR